MKSLLPLAASLALLITAPALADVRACPDLATAVQVGACPTEEELSYTYKGYCSDNARLYGRDEVDCANYQSYRKLKNIALWEAADGTFSAYIGCEPSPTSLKGRAPTRVGVSKQGKMTRVVCTYGNDVVFTYRTRAECRVEGDGDCAVNPAACRAHCDE